MKEEEGEDEIHRRLFRLAKEDPNMARVFIHDCKVRREAIIRVDHLIGEFIWLCVIDR